MPLGDKLAGQSRSDAAGDAADNNGFLLGFRCHDELSGDGLINYRLVLSKVPGEHHKVPHGLI
jgi:hypothetical protein